MDACNELHNCGQKERKASLGAFQHHGMLMGSNLRKRPCTSSMLHPDLSLSLNPFPRDSPSLDQEFFKESNNVPLKMPTGLWFWSLFCCQFSNHCAKLSLHPPPISLPSSSCACHRPTVEFKEAWSSPGSSSSCPLPPQSSLFLSLSQSHSVP